MKAYYQGAVGIILVYDVCDATSFQNIEYWVKKVNKHSGKQAEILLLGNKIDLINDRVVS